MTQLLWAPLLKKLQDMSQNKSFLISEIVRLLLLSQVTNAESEAIFSALKPENFASSNTGARSQEYSE